MVIKSVKGSLPWNGRRGAHGYVRGSALPISPTTLPESSVTTYDDAGGAKSTKSAF